MALRERQGALRAAVHAAVTAPRICLPFLTAGRLVRVQEGATDWGWGAVLQHSFRPPAAPQVRVSGTHRTVCLPVAWYREGAVFVPALDDVRLHAIHACVSPVACVKLMSCCTCAQW